MLLHCRTSFYLNAFPIHTISQHMAVAQELAAANQNRAPKLLSANKDRVIPHPSRQSIKIESYVTGELSTRLEDRSRLSN